MIRVFVSLLLGFVALASAGYVSASGNISFDHRLTGHEKILIDAYLKQSSDALDIARVDLNEDGLYEYIVRAGCSGLCTFRVLAESDDKIVELGDIRARALELGNAYTDSVRNIIAFRTPGNDYERTVYIWEPATARYMIKQE